MGLSMLQGQTSPAKSAPAETEGKSGPVAQIAVVPLGT